MSTENYLLSVDFTGGLNNHNLKKEVNDNVNIIKTCTDIRSDDDNVYIDFDDNLLIAEQTELNIVVSNYVYAQDEYILITDDFKYSDYSKRHILKTLTGVTFVADTKKTLINWSNSLGSLGNFNNTTGEMEFLVEGFYSFGLNSLVQTIGNNTKISVRLYDDSDNTKFVETKELNSLMTEATGGGTTMTAISYLQQGDKLLCEVQFAQNETCDFVLRIIKL